ncbi:HipA domain-containing protein [uncultured Amnibacterium sp.]|uniref:HipA domain-containing protein n=1 Tax=uncultured Amnibacterium sp. TaxID=1631851 RepID=UPI0035CC7265
MAESFQQIDITEWRFVRPETRGQGNNSWFKEPGGLLGPRGEWIFKPVKIHDNETRQGGDWAERAAAAIAEIAEVPVAEVQLARRADVEGCISRQVRDVDRSFASGRVWMNADANIEYRVASSRRSRHKRATRGYTLRNIRRSLRDVGSPPGFDLTTGMPAWSVFAGYLLLDAIIANRDRHEENWGVLYSVVGPEQARLAPAFDQESSLGFQLTNKFRRKVMAREGGVKQFVMRGTASCLSVPTGRQSPTLVEAAMWALDRIAASDRDHWLDRVDQLTPARVQDVFDRLPSMSEDARRFAAAVVNANVGRIQRERRRPSS